MSTIALGSGKLPGNSTIVIDINIQPQVEGARSNTIMLQIADTDNWAIVTDLFGTYMLDPLNPVTSDPELMATSSYVTLERNLGEPETVVIVHGIYDGKFTHTLHEYLEIVSGKKNERIMGLLLMSIYGYCVCTNRVPEIGLVKYFSLVARPHGKINRGDLYHTNGDLPKFNEYLFKPTVVETPTLTWEEASSEEKEKYSSIKKWFSFWTDLIKNQDTKTRRPTDL